MTKVNKHFLAVENTLNSV